MKKTFLARRWLAVLLALSMVVSMVPAVFAADEADGYKITITSTNLEVEVGKTLSLSAEVTKDGTVESGATIEWYSDATSKATVNSSTGEVTGVDAGTANISASYTLPDGVTTISASCEVTVKATDTGDSGDGDGDGDITPPAPSKPTSLSISPSGSQRLTSETQFTATVTDGEGNGTYSWTAVPADAVVISNPNSPITMISPGDVSVDTTVTITAAYTENGVTVSNRCTVTVPSPGNVLTGLKGVLQYNGEPIESLTVKTGNTYTLRLVLTKTTGDGGEFPVDGRNATFTWSSGSDSVFTASRIPNTDTATITPINPGNTTLTVTASYTENGIPQHATVTCSITVERSIGYIRITPAGPFTMEPDDQKLITATTDPAGQMIAWKSDDDTIASFQPSSQGTNGILYANSPGKTTITATIGEGDNTESQNIVVTVSGIVLEYDSINLTENEKQPIPLVTRYGTADDGRAISWQSMDNTIAEVSGSSVVGRGPGKTTITAFCGAYTASFTVEVGAGQNTIDLTSSVLKTGDTLPFSTLLSRIQGQVSGTLSYLTNLSVSTTQGTLYYNYISEAQPGQGVAQSENYYVTAGNGRKTISNITFVPKPGYSGPVTITYSAVNEAGTLTSCRILYTADQEEGSAFSLSTPYNTAINFNSTEFETACRAATGAQLDYVTFSLPPVRQGSLYTNYVSEGNYGRAVSTQDKFSRKEISDVWLVPAPGFAGTVTVYYTGHAVGGTGKTFSGQVRITVLPETGVSIGGLSYDVVTGGVAYFDDADFGRYCQDVLDYTQSLSFITFDSLPSADQGVLYYDYRSAANTGSRASAGTTYYYGTRTPRIDRLAFVPASDFTGTIRLPFTGQTTSGTRFAGNVEINVRSSNTGSGNIYYTCQPGKSVSFDDSHFNQLCRERVNDRLNYIQFQGLPNSVDGTLYYGSTAASANRSYYYGSTYPRIDSLSFRAKNGFTGSVDIPFIGTAASGETFYGIVTIDSKSVGTSSSDLHYYADVKNPAVFARTDFDDLSRWLTDRDVSSVKFDVPTSTQGALYQNYSSLTSKGTQITSNSTSILASSLNRIAFIPASGFTGSVSIGFTARATNNEEFSGTVEITVERAPADVTVSYTTQVAVIHFRGNDFARSGSTLKSIQFGAMPPSSAGRLYYQYNSPTQYDRQASTGSTYNLTGTSLISDLTFVPMAGFSGTFTLPYTGTNSNNTTFEGEVNITVYPTYTSAYFNDMAAYTDAQRSDVDYLYEQGVTSGVGSGRYGPTSSITRGDFALMVYKAFALSPRGSTQFSDVPASAYYAQAVNTLYAMGIVSGVGNGRYSPDSQVTREDAIIMVRQAMRSVGWSASDGASSTLNGYSDGSSVSQYAQGAVAYALQMGYLPTTNGRIDPRVSLTRVDMASILHRVLTS